MPEPKSLTFLPFSFHSPFKKLLIFSGRTLCATLFTAILLLKNRRFELTGSTLTNAKNRGNERFFLIF
jgi:hypothetical protein